MHVRCFSLHIDLSLKYCSITYWLTVEWAKGPGRKTFSMPLTEREQRDPCTIAEGQIISRQIQPDSVNKPFIIWPLRFFVSPLDPNGSEHFGLFLVSLCLVIFLYIYHCHIYHFIFEGCYVPNLFSISHIACAGPYVSSQGLMAISAHLYGPHTAFLSTVLQLNCARCCWLRFPSVFLIHHVKKLEILNSVSL